MEEVILVDENDVEIGTMEKMEAHQLGKLHRAFSIFIINSAGEMLLQQRAEEKYHSGGLWTNACCSHPRPNETIMNAAQRRLNEEMGFTTKLEKIFDFTYKASFTNGLTEHELDHVLIGKYEGEIIPDPNEVMDYKYISLDEINIQLQNNPNQFTPWFAIAFPKLKDWFNKNVWNM